MLLTQKEGVWNPSAIILILLFNNSVFWFYLKTFLPFYFIQKHVIKDVKTLFWVFCVKGFHSYGHVCKFSCYNMTLKQKTMLEEKKIY